jgi:SSS family solute:Na+ symporter
MITILILSVYLLGLLIYLKVSSKGQTKNDYLIADKKVALFRTTASIVSVIGGLVFVSQASLGYDLGVIGLFYFSGFSLGLFLLGFLIKKIKKIADKNNFLNISDYFHFKFGFKNGILATIIIFLAYFSYLTGQFIAAGILFGPLLNIPYWLAVLITGSFTFIYLFLGGYKAVIKTDLIQFLIMLSVFIIIFFNIENKDLLLFNNFENIVSKNSSSVITFILLGIFTIFSSVDIWQRIFSAKDIQTGRRAAFLAGIFFFFFGLILTLIGMIAKSQFPEIDSGEALYYGLFKVLPQSLSALVITAILAAIMSTIDTELYYLSLSVSKNLVFKNQTVKKSRLIKNLKFIMIILAVISILITVFFSQILILFFAIISLVFIISPALIGSLFFKLNRKAVFLSLSGGLLSILVLILTNNFNPDNSIITLPASILFLLIPQFIFNFKNLLTKLNFFR